MIINLTWFSHVCICNLFHWLSRNDYEFRSFVYGLAHFIIFSHFISGMRWLSCVFSYLQTINYQYTGLSSSWELYGSNIYMRKKRNSLDYSTRGGTQYIGVYEIFKWLILGIFYHDENAFRKIQRKCLLTR